MTPGAVAYAAFWATDLPDLRGASWAALPPSTQARWEAAAQAVMEKAVVDILEVQRILADAARRNAP